MASEKVLLHAVGDVAAFFKNPESMFIHTAAILNEADITFAQNERHYSNRYSEEHDLVPGAPLTEVTPLEHAAALKKGGFDVMSFASNHCMDLGADAMLETISALQDNGTVVIGAGKNIEEARKPAIFNRRGTKVGYLAYCSVMRPGYEAGVNRAGCTPMRASTFYQQLDYQPGTAPAVISLAYRDDLEAMKADIRKLRPQVDVLVASFHWGIHNVPATLAMYEREVAHAAIDAGVDLIIGHHAHILKGVEIYKGKAIFYSMGNFAFDYPLAVRMERRTRIPTSYLAALPFNPHQHHDWKIDPEYADWYCWSAEARKSMIVKCVVADKKIEKLSFLPVLINKTAQPEVVTSKPGIEEALTYIREISSSQGLNTEYSIDGAEIVVAI